MRPTWSARTVAALVIGCLVIATTAADASVTLPPSSQPLPATGTYLYLNSQPGEYIGEGIERLLTSRETTVWASLQPGSSYFTIRFLHQDVVDNWSIALDAPRGQVLAVGSYANAIRAGLEAPGQPGMQISVTGRGCNSLTGAFDVNEVTFSPEGYLHSFDATFEQHCDGQVAALFGRVHYVDETTPGVVLPAGTMTIPTSGTFLYFNNTRGFERLFTASDSRFEPWIKMTAGDESFHAIVIHGDDASPNVDLAAPVGQPLAVGSYVRAVRAMLRTPTAPGLDVGASCTVSGKFDIDALSFDSAGDLLLFQATFEQRCVGLSEVLYGRIRVESAPPTPKVVLPTGNIAVPSSGSFLYLKSEPFDYVGGGAEALYTGNDAEFTGDLNEAGDFFEGLVQRNNFEHFWFVDVAAPAGVPLATGSYRHVERAAFRSDGLPGLDVSGDSRGCNTVMGRFDVDDFALWPDGELKLIQVTFEEHCEGLVSALYGRYRYEAPALALAVSAREDVLVVSKGALAVVSGTVSCGSAVVVDVSGSVRESDTKGRVATGSFSTTIECIAPSVKWQTTVTPDNTAFFVGSGSVSAQATACRRLCHTVTSSRSAKFSSGKS